MNITVLHNSDDKVSRDFVATLPTNDGNVYCVIDWYKQLDQIRSRTCCAAHMGQPYCGPSPSCFPELVFRDDAPPDLMYTDMTGKQVIVKQVSAWVRIRAAVSVLDVLDRSKFDTRVPDSPGIGGP